MVSGRTQFIIVPTVNLFTEAEIEKKIFVLANEIRKACTIFYFSWKKN